MINYSAFIYYSGISVCKISYTEYSEIDFLYVFEPIYEHIDSLDSFRGIQGIDLSLRKPAYIRKNLMPSFIFEHNPLPGKKLFQVSMKVNGKCLLEFLADSEKRYFGDKLYIRK